MKKYSKILSAIFFLFLFFQINQAKADETCIGMYLPSGKTCESSKLGNTYRPDSGKCARETFPGACQVNPMPANCTCCCGAISAPTQPTKTDMPQLTNPLDNLQIKIPGLVYSSLEKVKAACAKDGSGKLTSCIFPWIGEYIAGIYKYAIGIVGILAAVVLMIGGLLWIVAGGNATAIGEAKAWIGASLTGLVIALCSYVILYQVNPALLEFRGLNIKMAEKIELPGDLIAESNIRSGQPANDYKSQDCSRLNNGDTADFFITSYCKPLITDFYTQDSFLCAVALNCSCPGNKKDTSKICTGSVDPWSPCLPISNNNYCDRNAAGNLPAPNTIAADLSCFKLGSTLAIDGKNYTVQDSGGAIKGRRLDVWSESCKNLSMNGVKNVTIISK